MPLADGKRFGRNVCTSARYNVPYVPEEIIRRRPAEIVGVTWIGKWFWPTLDEDLAHSDQPQGPEVHRSLMDQAEIPICEEPSRVDVTVREHVIESGSEPESSESYRQAVAELINQCAQQEADPERHLTAWEAPVKPLGLLT